MTAVLAISSFSVEAQPSPFADVQKLGSISMGDDSVLNCAETKAGDPKRKETIGRRFTRVEFDACLWTSRVDQTDLAAPAALFRAGADVTCILEEVEDPAASEPDEQMLPKHLRSKGLVDVMVVSSRDARKFDGLLRQQIVSARMPQGDSPYSPMVGVRSWIWSGFHRQANFICLGPEAAIATEASVIDGVGDSIQIRLEAID